MVLAEVLSGPVAVEATIPGLALGAFQMRVISE